MQGYNHFAWNYAEKSGGGELGVREGKGERKGARA